ncbi:sensor histidine kinase [Streptomyces roseoverticillatus]|uniref:sensor histidine kinase n=1 Tax=Streptomyces roseoverticillatus TaxID=66429 RepID=UPI001F2AA5BC|nr:sensor histidine kinase [Streptomyces roseoverticillatus]MCF3106043.1 sensor histidine kinase [Streptomyces roseoverticillatus]
MQISGVLTALRRPFDGAGRAAAFLATGVLVQLGALLVMAVPWLNGGPTKALSCVLAVVGMAGILAVACPVLSRMHRARCQGWLEVEIPVAGRPWSWRQLGYHLAAGPLLALGGALTLLLWAAAGVAATVYVWIWALPPETRVEHLGYTTQAVYVTAAGLAGLYGAAWLSRTLARLDTRAATARLGPSRAELLEMRVEEVTESRAGVLDAADAERRRIERDLHDGAQQRLVSMAVNLGLAKVTLKDLPEDARKVIDEAHREAKEAIAELSNLVRGLHPAVLEDRGLDAALSGIAERAPLPVGLTADLPVRPAPAVEAVAYFVVSEALANVVKHARAGRADVRVETRGGILLVVVTDDGVGGAAPEGGTGLAGLAKRVASVDGTFSISSPAGGPTVVTVELPCAL